MNILIVKLSAIGDVIHTLPALVALRRHFPRAHISWIVEEAGAELLRGHAALDQLIVWQRREFEANCNSFHWIKAARVFGGVLRQVRRRRYDLVIDFQALLKSALWVFLSRGKRKVGFGPGMHHSEGSHHFLSERIPSVSMEVHALERGLLLLEAVGVSLGALDYQLPCDGAAEVDVDAFLHKAGGGDDSPLVVVHPVARWRTKLWINERFAALADALQAQGICVVFSGGSGDAAFLDEIQGTMKTPCRRYDGRGGLRHLAALCRRARVVVSTDTGPMHLAAAVGTPVVALFGPTAPNRTGPYGPEHIVLRAAVPCSPCFKRRCESTVVEEFGCMRRIQTERVLETVLHCISNGGCHALANPADQEQNAFS